MAKRINVNIDIKRANLEGDFARYYNKLKGLEPWESDNVSTLRNKPKLARYWGYFKRSVFKFFRSFT